MSELPQTELGLSVVTQELTKPSQAAETSSEPKKASPKPVAATEADLALEKFASKLAAWLPLQYEWSLLLAKPKPTRKRMARVFADTIFKAPPQDPKGLPRHIRRALGLW